MQFDDRLATVLRMQVGNERAVNTQFRQLLDLAGSAPEGANGELLQQAFARLETLCGQIDAHTRAAMIREPGMRLRNPELIAFLADQELPVASSAMAAARLDTAQWDALIPTLPIPARALLRARPGRGDRLGGVSLCSLRRFRVESAATSGAGPRPARHSMPRNRASPLKVSASNQSLERWLPKWRIRRSTLRSRPSTDMGT